MGEKAYQIKSSDQHPVRKIVSKRDNYCFKKKALKRQNEILRHVKAAGHS